MSNNLKNVTNRLRTAVGLAPTTISADDDMTSPMNLGQSLLSSEGNEPGGSYTALNTTEPLSVTGNGRSYDYGNLSLTEEERLKKQEEQIMKEIRARKLIEEEDRKLAERLQGDGDDMVMLKVQVPKNLYGGQIINVQIPGLGVKSVQIPLGLQPGDSFMITTSKFQPGGGGTVRVKIPGQVAVGDTFLVILPDGNRVSVTVPPGAKTGDELLIPARGGSGSAQVQQSRIRLSDREVLAAMTHEEKEFMNALPKEMHEDAIQEKRQALIREFETGGGAMAASAPPPSSNRRDQSNWVPMVQATIPEGVEVGQEFKMIMPDGRAIMVEVPPGMQAGDSIGVPANAGTEAESAQQNTPKDTKPVMSEEEKREKEEFLAALPPDIRAEVLASEAREEGNVNVSSSSDRKNNTEASIIETEHQQQQQPPADSPLIDFATLGNSTTTIEDGENNSNGIETLDYPTLIENVNIDNLSGDQKIATPSVLSTGFSAAPAAQTLQPNQANQFNQDQATAQMSTPSSYVNPGTRIFDMQQQPPPSYETAAGAASNVSNPFDVATSAPTATTPNHVPTIAPSEPNTDAFASLSIHEQVPKSPPKSQQIAAVRETPPKTPLEKLREAKTAFEKGEIDQVEFNRIKQEVIRAL